jgi:hypothetical protein
VSSKTRFSDGILSIRAGLVARWHIRLRKAAEERRRGAARLLGILVIILCVAAAVFGAAFGGGAYLARMDALDLLRPGVSVLLVGVSAALILSSLGHAANAFFSSRDLWFWASSPAPAWARFCDRCVETGLAALPATFLLGLLAMVGLLAGADVGLAAVVRGVLSLALLATVPVSLGVVLAHLGGSLLPAGRMRRVTILIVAIATAGMLGVLRSARVEQVMTKKGAERFLDEQRDLRNVGPEWLPNNIGADFVVTGELSSLAVLFSVAAVLLFAAYLAHRLLYRRARDLADDESPTGLRRGSFAEGALRFSTRFTDPRIRPLLEKDLLAFVRDPSQWSQLVLLGGIAVIYIINAQALVMGFEPFPERVRSILLGGMHVGLVTFIAAGLSARFAFPQLGLEGPAVWMVEGSPLSPERVVRAKFLATLPVVAVFPTTVAALGAWVIELHPGVAVVSTAAVALVAISLAAYGVGRGSVSPVFDAANVSELAMGPGALSTMAIAVAICGFTAFMTWLAAAAMTSDSPGIGLAAGIFFLSLPCLIAARAGRRALRRGAEAFFQRREDGTAGTGAFPAAAEVG